MKFKVSPNEFLEKLKSITKKKGVKASAAGALLQIKAVGGEIQISTLISATAVPAKVEVPGACSVNLKRFQEILDTYKTTKTTHSEIEVEVSPDTFRLGNTSGGKANWGFTFFPDQDADSK
jgi:DNA polymerase III sliding clamp (beta) subunit (PCNA family)